MITRSFFWQFTLLLLALPGVSPHLIATEPGSMRKLSSNVDEAGDSLPAGAVARIGTVRLRQTIEVCSVAFSPDGKLLATGGRYDGVRLFDSVSGKLFRFLPAKGGQGVFHLAFAPDGKTLASGGFDGALELWDVAAAKKSRELGADSSSSRLGPFCFSGDGKLFAVANGENLRIWQTASWTEQNDRKVVLASFAGRRMYVGEGPKGDQYLWDVGSLEKQVVPLRWRTGRLRSASRRRRRSGWQPLVRRLS
jgi:WD40 repeat protein